MFDIGFSELLLIAVVALIVIGPQRLPKVARTLGHLFGRMQRYVNDVKADIAREMELDEFRKMQSSVEDAARSMRDSFTREMSEAEKQLDELTQEAQREPGAEPASGRSDPAATADGQQRDPARDAGPGSEATKPAPGGQG